MFLFLWAGIFLLAAAFLLGQIKLKGETGEIGAGRLVGGVGTLMLAIYFGALGSGHKLDNLMLAIAPNYSGVEVSAAKEGPAEHDYVVDDYGKAREIAIASKRKLLINFTGVT